MGAGWGIGRGAVPCNSSTAYGNSACQKAATRQAVEHALFTITVLLLVGI